MRFGQEIESHLTPEWRSQYIQYKAMKAIFCEPLKYFDGKPDPETLLEIEKMFFERANKELNKINMFFKYRLGTVKGCC